jgi:PST family polysaccharide transporter
VSASRPAGNSYRQILKASALTGGSTAINIVLGIVRTKVTAVLLGPAGFGLMSLYGSICEVAVALAGMGLNSSGVRQIAAAVGSGDTERIARTTTVLRRVSLVLGTVGMASVAALSGPISALTFGTDRYAGAVALLSLVVLFRLVSGGQAALIQGMRRVSDLARMRVLGGIFGTIVSIPLIYLFREQGIVPSLVAAAAMTVLTSWWFSRSVQVPRSRMTTGQVGQEAGALLKLGLAFMTSGFLSMGAAYVIRLIVIRESGLAAAGLYQSAWVLGGLYVSFILQAMGSDLYPRLTAIATDDRKCNRLVNEQTLISILLAGPGVIATLALAPLVIILFYSPEFRPAAGLLRWVCLGMILRVVAFPIGYVVLAKGYQRVFLWNEISVSVVHVGLAVLLVNWFGVAGATMAFALSCLWHAGFIYVVVRRRTGFRWSTPNHRLIVLFLPMTVTVFCSFYVLPFWPATAFGMTCAAVTGCYAAWTLLTLVSDERLRWIQQRVPDLPVWLRLSNPE